MDGPRCRRWGTLAGVATLTLVAVGPAAAHGASIGGTRETVSVPTWLFLMTGGAAIGASFLLASLVTDRTLISAIHDWRRPFGLPGERLFRWLLQAIGVLGLLGVIVVGVAGPQFGKANAAVLFVWVGWWAGFTMSAYLLGSTWRALNPWRTIAAVLPSLELTYPDRLGTWPSSIGLLGLVWLEVVSPIAQEPQVLAAVVVGYTVVTLAGAVVFGPETWFETVDPISQVYQYYSRLAPITREGGRLTLRIPGTALSETRLIEGFDDVGFVIALLWATTYDGFVATPDWKTLAGPAVSAGVPSEALYLFVLAAGYLLFVGIYTAGARYSRQFAGTYLSTATLTRRFAPPLLAIAAGYHLAHYLGYFLSLSPTLFATARTPLTRQVMVPTLALPGWFNTVSLASVLLGHLLAIWAAHATAFDLFPGRIQAIRSQYPYIVIMILYTMTSLWIVSQPTIKPPYL